MSCPALCPASCPVVLTMIKLEERDFDIIAKARLKMLYAIGNSAKGPLKIGFCGGALKRRLDNLRVGNWRELHLQSCFLCPEHIYIREAEQSAHIAMERCGGRIRGEWFSVSTISFDLFCQASGYVHFSVLHGTGIPYWEWEAKKRGIVRWGAPPAREVREGGLHQETAPVKI